VEHYNGSPSFPITVEGNIRNYCGASRSPRDVRKVLEDCFTAYLELLGNMYWYIVQIMNFPRVGLEFSQALHLIEIACLDISGGRLGCQQRSFGGEYVHLL
jgi:hypothetical protein